MKTILTAAALALFAASPVCLAAEGAAPAANTNALNGPSLALAEEGARAAMAACKAKGYVIGVAVVDERGGLRLVVADDGTTPQGPNGARRKAITTAMIKMNGDEIVSKIKTDKALADQVAANKDFLVREGSILIKTKAGKIVGALGVEGPPPHKLDLDQSCAQVGVDTIQAKLQP